MSEDNRSSLYVAQHPETKKYSVILRFLMGEKGWMESAKPSIEEVKKQIDFVASRRPIWTDDINEADVWGEYTMKEYGKYLEPIEFVNVHLTCKESS
jgi:hypothetical protein